MRNFEQNNIVSHYVIEEEGSSAVEFVRSLAGPYEDKWSATCQRNKLLDRDKRLNKNSSYDVKYLNEGDYYSSV